MNNKKECSYDLIFENVTRLINMGFREIKYFKTITTDNETALINSVKKYFPNIVRISCWFHLKNNLEKKARSLGLKKKENLENTKKVINSLGILPAIYNGDLNDLNDKIEKLKIKYKNYTNFIDDFLDNNIEYFKDGSLEYSKFPAHIRTNSVLENYNGFLKSELGKKKEINYMSFLNFLLNEDERFYEMIIKKINNVQLIIQDRPKYNTNSNNFIINNSNNNKIKEISNFVIDKKAKSNWLRWVNNSCRYDSLLTLYLLVFKNYIDSKDKYQYLSKFELINKLDTTINILMHDPESEERFKLWSYYDFLKLDTNSNKSLFGEEGYITGLFKIFENNNDFCLEFEKISTCIICFKEEKINIFYNPLIALDTNIINIGNLEKIINYKFSLSIEECKIDKLISCQIKYNILNYPNFMFFVLDLNNNEYINKLNELCNIFKDIIHINDKIYEIKACIFHINNNHFTTAVFNIEKDILNLKKNKNYYHDGTKNDGNIIELKESFSELIKKLFPYIIILKQINKKI